MHEGTGRAEPSGSYSADESGGSPAATPPRVRVRYWAAAKAAAGVDGEELGGRTVADVLAAARDSHRDEPRFATVLAVCSFLLGEEPVGSRDLTAIAVSDGDTLDVLPPFAGG
jgi:molybdopterin converting factor small subunit